MENGVKIHVRNGSGRYMLSETSVDIFLAKMKVSRIGEKCFVNLATPEGGVELELPRSSAVNIIEQFLAMLPHDELRALLAGVSERM